MKKLITLYGEYKYYFSGPLTINPSEIGDLKVKMILN